MHAENRQTIAPLNFPSGYWPETANPASRSTISFSAAGSVVRQSPATPLRKKELRRSTPAGRPRLHCSNETRPFDTAGHDIRCVRHAQKAKQFCQYRLRRHQQPAHMSRSSRPSDNALASTSIFRRKSATTPTACCTNACIARASISLRLRHQMPGGGQRRIPRITHATPMNFAVGNSRFRLGK